MGVMVLTTLALGSSPRVRSGPRGFGAHRVDDGIISACAERSAGGVWMGRSVGDHLRVCGAVELIAQMVADLAGSSPRVRSGPDRSRATDMERRIISACAERSS